MRKTKEEQIIKKVFEFGKTNLLKIRDKLCKLLKI